MKDIERVFLISSSLFFINSLIYLFTSVYDDKWLSRLSIALISLGFYAILKKMDNGKH